MHSRSVSALTLSIWLVAAPASALDISVGGVDIGADVDIGGGGVSVGVDVDVDGVGGANVGGSVGSGGVSVDVDVDGVGGVNVGGAAGPGTAAADTDVGGTTGPETGGTAAGGVDTPNNTTASTGGPSPRREAQAPGRPSAKAAVKPVKPLRSVGRAIALPPLLRPTGEDRSWRRAFGYPAGPFVALKAKAGVLPEVVRSCRSAIASAARPLGATRVEAVSAGKQRRVGELVYAPVDVRIQYARQGSREIRQAKVSCRINAAGQVVAVR